MDINYIIAIQEMIETYSKIRGKKSAKELLNARGEYEQPGYLSAHHKIILQEMIFEYALSQGKNINDEIKDNENKNKIPTILSKTEISYIDPLLQLYMSSKENKMKVV